MQADLLPVPFNGNKSKGNNPVSNLKIIANASCFPLTVNFNKLISSAFNLGRYSTFQYPDQDAYQDAYPEDFNADAVFHVSVSVKRYACVYLTINSAYIISLSFTW